MKDHENFLIVHIFWSYIFQAFPFLLGSLDLFKRRAEEGVPAVLPGPREGEVPGLEQGRGAGCARLQTGHEHHHYDSWNDLKNSLCINDLTMYLESR